MIKIVNFLVCLTNGGPDPNKPCMLPFTYNGITYTSCTSVLNYGIDWCSTEIDAYGNHVGMKWGNCGTGCPAGNDVYLFVKLQLYMVKFKYLHI